MEVQEPRINWGTIKDDIVALEGLCTKEVAVYCTNGQCFRGVVQSVDPVSKSLVVAKVEDGKVKDLTVCVGSAIREITVSSQPSRFGRQVEQLFAQSQSLSPSEIKCKREQLLKHLQAKSLPCTVDGNTIRVGTFAHIEPPYTKSELYCTNEIIQERVAAVMDELSKL